MRILIIHNYYTLDGGEDTVFKQEAKLLSSEYDIDTLTFHNREGARGAIQFLFSLYNLSTFIRVKEKVQNFKPDVVHIHNLHFAAGPTVIRYIAGFNIPIVVTLHNFRLICPSTTLLNGDKVYLDSINKSFPWKAVKIGLYRNSQLLTFWLVFVTWFHTKIGTWSKVGTYLTLTEFSRNIFSSNVRGISEDNISVKPNFVEDSGASYIREQHFLFVGRLSNEKGIQTLLDAFSYTASSLYVVGKGPLELEVKEHATKFSNIIYCGAMSAQEVRSEMSRCEALIFPSIWFEGMPMTILEAFSTGTPIIASNLGNMAEMVTHGYNGFLFKPGDANDLSRQVMAWEALSYNEKQVLRKNARKTFEQKYNSEANLAMLKEIYRDAISKHKVS
jgi:glycosyltransferase involved in cell wall biosynthesis